MRWAWRLLAGEDLISRYLLSGCGRVGGLWYDEVHLAGSTPDELVREVGLDYTLPDGRRPFTDAEIGLLRFPVTEAVLARSTIPRARGAGGDLPDPPASVSWMGTGFAPGARLMPAYLLGTIGVPDGSELAVISDEGQVFTVRRWQRGSWLEP